MEIKWLVHAFSVRRLQSIRSMHRGDHWTMCSGSFTGQDMYVCGACNEVVTGCVQPQLRVIVSSTFSECRQHLCTCTVHLMPFSFPHIQRKFPFPMPLTLMSKWILRRVCVRMKSCLCGWCLMYTSEVCACVRACVRACMHAYIGFACTLCSCME